jgi:hypothetical protein
MFYLREIPTLMKHMQEYGGGGGRIGWRQGHALEQDAVWTVHRAYE